MCEQYKPLSRYQPYLVGLGLGYLLHTMRNQPTLKLNPIAITWLWLLASLTACLVIYGLVPYQVLNLILCFLHLILLNIFLLLCLLLLLLLVLLSQQKDMTLEASITARSLYGGLHRLAWALAVAWVILACVKVLLLLIKLLLTSTSSNCYSYSVLLLVTPTPAPPRELVAL